MALLHALDACEVLKRNYHQV